MMPSLTAVQRLPVARPLVCPIMGKVCSPHGKEGHKNETPTEANTDDTGHTLHGGGDSVQKCNESRSVRLFREFFSGLAVGTAASTRLYDFPHFTAGSRPTAITGLLAPGGTRV